MSIHNWMLGFWGTDQALYLPSERQRGSNKPLKLKRQHLFSLGAVLTKEPRTMSEIA